MPHYSQRRIAKRGVGATPSGGFLPFTLTKESATTVVSAQSQAAAVFSSRLNVIEAETNAILAERTRRMAGATPMMLTSKSINRWYRIPEPADGCPALGPLALTWQDLFDRAKANLAALAALRPPRGTPGVRVVRWFRAMRWNLLLLLDATNIRPVFRFPTDFQTAPLGNPEYEEWRRGDQVTLFTRTGSDGQTIVEGKPYPKAGYSEGGYPTGIADMLSPAERGVVLPDIDSWDNPAPPVWFTALDQSAELTPAWFNVLDQLPGSQPGLVIDQNPADIPAWQRRICMSRSYADVFDECWRTGQPVKVATCNNERPFFVDLGAWIDRYIAVAAVYAQLDLPTMLLKSIGWYVFNHVPYWKNKGMISIDDAKVERLQDAVTSAAVRTGLAPVRLVGSLAAAVNPVVGAVVSMILEIGFNLLDTFLVAPQEQDTPRRLFVRSYPASCAGVEAEDDLTLANEEASLTRALSEQQRQEQARREAEAAALEADRLDLIREAEQRNRQQQTFPWLPVLGGVGAALALGIALRSR